MNSKRQFTSQLIIHRCERNGGRERGGDDRKQFWLKIEGKVSCSIESQLTLDPIPNVGGTKGGERWGGGEEGRKGRKGWMEERAELEEKSTHQVGKKIGQEGRERERSTDS